MKRRLSYSLILAFELITAGCTRDFDLKLKDTRPLYVIEGRISNLVGPYLVRVTKASRKLYRIDISNPGLDSAEPVKDALVIISDDMGTIDTLIPPPFSTRWRYEYKNNGIDSTLTYLPFYHIEQGYYETTKIRGVAGHTYHLQVQIGNEKFDADAYMPRVPDLDSVVLRDTIFDVTDGRSVLLPLAYFKEPQNEKNYYWLSFGEIHDYPYDTKVNALANIDFSPYYVVDDKILPPYVNGLAMLAIVSDHYPFWKYYNYPSRFIFEEFGLQVKLSSLTKDTYTYFNEHRKQMQVDGNVYKPTPASAKGNISNGALGHFWATEVSYKVLLP